MDGIESSSSQPGHLTESATIVYSRVTTTATRGRLTKGGKDRQTDKI